jgi:hypothetical protein
VKEVSKEHYQQIFFNPFVAGTTRAIAMKVSTYLSRATRTTASGVLVPRAKNLSLPQVGLRAALRTYDFGQKRAQSSSGGATTVSCQLAYVGCNSHQLLPTKLPRSLLCCDSFV